MGASGGRCDSCLWIFRSLVVVQAFYSSLDNGERSSELMCHMGKEVETKLGELLLYLDLLIHAETLQALTVYAIYHQT